MVPVCLICSTGNFMKDKTMFKKLYSLTKIQQKLPKTSPQNLHKYDQKTLR